MSFSELVDRAVRKVMLRHKRELVPLSKILEEVVEELPALSQLSIKSRQATVGYSLKRLGCVKKRTREGTVYHISVLDESDIQRGS